MVREDCFSRTILSTVSEQAGSQVLYCGYTLYAIQSFYSTKDGRVIQSLAREWLDIHGEDLKDNETKDWNGLMSWLMELKLYKKENAYVFTRN